MSVTPEHHFAERRCRVSLPGKDVLVDLHGEGDAGVAEALADHFDRDSLLEHEGGVRVPQVVETDARIDRSPVTEEPHSRS